MSVSEQVRILCAKINVSQAELARRLGQSPQNFSAKIKRDSLSISDMEEIASVLGVEFNHKFICADGTQI